MLYGMMVLTGKRIPDKLTRLCGGARIVPRQEEVEPGNLQDRQPRGLE